MEATPDNLCGVNLSRRSVLATALLGTVVEGRETTHRDTIDLDRGHQTIENFGASDCWSMQKIGTWSLANRRRIAELLFSQDLGIGLSCWRFNIGGGITDKIIDPWRTVETFEVGEGRYDWSRQAPERWFLQAAKAAGVPQFLAFVNSPPGRMTRTGITYGQAGLGTTNLKPGFEGQYARYLADILDHFRIADRVTFDHISPVNEPNAEWNGKTQEGCRSANADIKTTLRALDAELKRRKCPTRIAGIEAAGIEPLYSRAEKISAKYGAPYGDYLEAFLEDRSVSGLLDHRLLYHDYGSDRLQGELVEHRRRLHDRMAKYPGWKLWMSEYCVLTGSEGKGGTGRDLTMNTALDVARIIHLDLTMVGVTAWQWWTAVSPVDYKDGLIYTNYRKSGDPESILPARLLWAFGNYSRFVRPGMQRVELIGQGHDVRGLMGSAYKDENAKRVAAVYVNMGATAQAVQLGISPGPRDWRLKAVTPYVTSDREGDELKAYPAAGPGQPVEIPARSVVTLVAQFS
jgi:O-glycosyl hydrolase